MRLKKVCLRSLMPRYGCYIYQYREFYADLLINSIILFLESYKMVLKNILNMMISSTLGFEFVLYVNMGNSCRGDARMGNSSGGAGDLFPFC